MNRYKSLSLGLYQVMEGIGANAELRNMNMEISASYEISPALVYQPVMSLYIFGSQYERTKTPWKPSDIDCVLVSNHLELVTNISQSRASKCLLFIQDASTPAGYFKLQLVQNGVPLFKRDSCSMYALEDLNISVCCDNEQRLVCYFQRHSGTPLPLASEWHGPALKMKWPGSQEPTDGVYALRSNNWPDCAAEWLSRKRSYNWPSIDLMEQCQSMGFLVVPVGHPKSEEGHLQ